MPTHQSVHAAKFKSKARSLLKAVKAGDAAAIKRVKPYFQKVHEFKLTQAQLVVARELKCSSWRELIARQDWLACSFCKKWQYDLKKLIAGPDVYVCDACVGLCNEILRESRDASTA